MKNLLQLLRCFKETARRGLDSSLSIVKQRSIDPAMVQLPGVGSVFSVVWEHGNGVRPTLSDGV